MALAAAKPPFVIGEGGSDQNVDFGHVLHMDMRIGARDARAERRDGLVAFAGAIIGVTCGAKIGARKIVAVRPFATQNAIAHAKPVSAVSGAEDAAQIVAPLSAD